MELKGAGRQPGIPDLVVAADWSVSQDKRWMARAERISARRYLVWPPEPVGDLPTLIARIREALPPGGVGVIGFDFPIGLPRAFARRAGFSHWRDALTAFGGPGWERFYLRSDSPSLQQPFFPLPKGKGQKGYGRKMLADGLGFGHVEDLYRRCELGDGENARAECLFFTSGATQVGAGAMIGWQEVLRPNMDVLRFWPFDGGWWDLVRGPGMVVAEVYPRDAYRRLGVAIGPGTGRSKTRREDRRPAAQAVLGALGDGEIRISNAARSWFDWGFEREDDFDAMMGLLSMLRIITGRHAVPVPDDDPWVGSVEGWILGRRGG